MSRNDENDIYVIPPNFIETGTVFGGTIKLRNAAEATVIALLIGIPVFHIPVSLTARIIIACLTVLPATLFALIGIGGESLSSFVLNFFLFLKNRRIVGITEDEPRENEQATTKKPAAAKKIRQQKPKKESFSEEFGDHADRRQTRNERRQTDSGQTTSSVARPADMLNPVASYLPIRKIENGIIYTKDHRYVKVIEVMPINFLLRSAREQRNIIYSFVGYLKISPVKLQFKVLTRRADINRHLETIREEMKTETDERCLALQRDYENLIRQIGTKEAITRRFFIVFEHEPLTANRGNEEKEAITALATAVRTAETYLRQCGNEVLTPENENEMATEVLYSVLNRRSSTTKPLNVRINEVVGQYVNAGKQEDLDHIPAMEFMAPESIDYTHGSYVMIDGVYQTYLLIPSEGYRPQVYAGWISLLVNAGEGIDVDIFFDRQPKDRIQQKLEQQLRINRSKIKDTSDTNSDYDDLDGAIRSGYYLKDGLASNEDFYYMNILITITGDSLDELEWRTSEMKKLLISRDMDIIHCHFREEQALLSSLPLVSLDKSLFDRSKRNILTTSAAGCYPFTSFEMRCVTTTASCWESTNITTP